MATALPAVPKKPTKPAQLVEWCIHHNQKLENWTAVDLIAKGDVTVTPEDLRAAIYNGFRFLATEQRVSSFNRATRTLMVNWYTDKHNCVQGTDPVKNFDHQDLLVIFRDMCTMIEEIMASVEDRGDSTHKEVLRGQALQNWATDYQNDMIQTQHWNME